MEGNLHEIDLENFDFENFDHLAIKPIKTLTDIISDENRASGQDHWYLCALLQEKVAALSIWF